MHAHLSLLPSLLVCLAGSMASGQTFRILPALEGYGYAEATGISSNGRYVGGCSGVGTGTLWDEDRKPRELPVLSWAFGISDDASVIVGTTYWPDARAIVLTPSGVVDLGIGRANAVDAQGNFVVGYLEGYLFPPIAFCYHTSTGALIDLQPAVGDESSEAWGINDAGTLVVGYSVNDFFGQRRACLWNTSGGRPLVVLDSQMHYALGFGVSGDGSIVVGEAYTQPRKGAARWDNGHLEIIATPAGAGATDVTDDGRLILGYVPSPTQEWNMGFLFDTTRGLQPLRQVLHIDVSEVAWASLRSMSSDGRRIVGSGAVSGHGRAALEVVLEPCPADFNADFVADFFDYLDFVALYDVQDLRADFNGDEQVDFFDYLDFVAAFEAGCD